jgi:hypothetical protein
MQLLPSFERTIHLRGSLYKVKQTGFAFLALGREVSTSYILIVLTSSLLTTVLPTIYSKPIHQNPSEAVIVIRFGSSALQQEPIPN